jgi:predicted TIM-barrel fold metal-dependent hydrolase
MSHRTLIDTHQHPVPDVYKRALAKVGIHGSGENPWPAWSLQSQLELMDEMNIAAVINSVASPGAYFGNIDEAIRIARDCNDDAAKTISEHPHRLGAFALLPMPDLAASIREVEYALDKLQLEGVCLLSHAGQRHLGHPDEDELYAELDRRKAIVSCIRSATRRRTCRHTPTRQA